MCWAGDMQDANDVTCIYNQLLDVDRGDAMQRLYEDLDYDSDEYLDDDSDDELVIQEQIKRCPAPGCDLAIDFYSGRRRRYDVTCSCSYRFCWNCTEEAHSPVDCETMSKWITKNNAESENMKLMLMDSEGKKEMALEQRYTHYYERWATHESSRQKAVADLEQVQTVDLARLSEKTCEPKAMLDSILEAWLQVIECRQVLKWTYVYGFYLPEQQVAKREFFELLQGEAEALSERLHQYVKKDFYTYLDATDVSEDDFKNFREKLDCWTTATRDYFDNIVRELEDGPWMI